MAKYLIDVNLPMVPGLWDNEDFLHQANLGRNKADDAIWEYARFNNLTIVSKDGDFYGRILFAEPPPRVIHIRLGNMLFHEFKQFMFEKWTEIAEKSERFKLIIIYNDRIEEIE